MKVILVGTGLIDVRTCFASLISPEVIVVDTHKPIEQTFPVKNYDIKPLLIEEYQEWTRKKKPVNLDWKLRMKRLQNAIV